MLWFRNGKATYQKLKNVFSKFCQLNAENRGLRVRSPSKQKWACNICYIIIIKKLSDAMPDFVDSCISLELVKADNSWRDGRDRVAVNR